MKSTSRFLLVIAALALGFARPASAEDAPMKSELLSAYAKITDALAADDFGGAKAAAGALVIVLWYSLILHARWGGLVRQRGLMNLAVFGNIVTAGSWFGVNMLGVGLHSYGFTDSAAFWLVGFVLSQVAVMMVAALPLEKWRSGAAIFGPAPSPREREPVAREVAVLEEATH